MKHLRLRIEDELHRTIKIIAAENDKTIHDVAVEALAKFFEKKKEK